MIESGERRNADFAARSLGRILEISRPVQKSPGLDKNVRPKQVDLRLYPYFDRPTAPLTPTVLFTPHVKIPIRQPYLPCKPSRPASPWESQHLHY